MTATVSLSRRNLLQAGAVGGAVLLIGIPPARAGAAAPAAFSPSAVLRIAADGAVTIILPKSEMGQGVYTTIPMLIAEELDVPLSAVAIEVPGGERELFKPLSQDTGGSTSIRETWEPMRQAGANARAVLVAAAAAQWKVAPESCRTEGGKVIDAAGKRSIGYGDLVAAASALPVPEKAPLKEPSAFRVIGQPTVRLDAPGKTDGTIVYGVDVKIPGMKIATLQASPSFGGKLKSANDAAAMAIKGVRQVVKLEDVVAVVADHYWAAHKGLEALAPVWDAGPNAGLQQAAIDADLAAALAREGKVANQAGDVATAMKGAAKRVEATYAQPFLAHAAMEPGNCTVHVRADRCDVWTGTQIPADARATAATAAGLPVEKVILHNYTLGGSFGRRLEADMIARAVAIAKQVDSPVKVVWSREEDVRQDIFRPAYQDRLVAGLDAAGKPVAWTHRIVGSSIMARLYPKYYDGVDADAVEGAAKPPYELPNLTVDYVRQESAITTGWWRGVGPLRSTFVVESFIDELAAAAGADPLAYRIGLAKDPRAKEVLRLVGEKAGWGKPLAKGWGRGVSLVQAWDSYLAQVAEVEMSAEGEPRVHRVVAVVDCGLPINPTGIKAQVEGGIIFGLSAALYGKITIAGGAVEQSNYHDYPLLRMNNAPRVEAHVVTNTEKPGGMGEPPTAGAAAALANAVFAATGQRLRSLPIVKTS